MTDSYRKKLEEAANYLRFKTLEHLSKQAIIESWTAGGWHAAGFIQGAQFILDNPPTDAWVKRSDVKALVEALQTLRIAVEDKGPDPGAVAFIDKALERIGGKS